VSELLTPGELVGSDATRRPMPLHPRDVLFESGGAAEAQATVCITLYNYGESVIEALDSCFEQTLEHLSVAVLDDCSSDKGADRVERWMRHYGSRFAGVRLVRHRQNGGLAAARNGVIDTAESPFVMVLDADNLLYPRCVERLLSGLEPSDHAFAYSIIEQFDGRTGLMGYYGWSPELLRQNNYIDAMALVRKSSWEAVHGYSKMLVGGWEDYDFWCKCAERGFAGLFVPEILARYRVHAQSMLRTETDAHQNSKLVRAEMRERHHWLLLDP